jgi:hypothetical protein
MNHVAGYELLSAEISRYQALSFDEIRGLIGKPHTQIIRKGGIDYEVTTSV